MIGILLSLIEDLLRPISGRLGISLRRFWYERRLGSCGRRLRIDAGVFLTGCRHIYLGDDVVIDKHAILTAGPSTGMRRRPAPPAARHVEPGEIRIGRRSHLGIGMIIQGHGGVLIGDCFTASSGCAVYSLSNDPYRCREGTVATDDSSMVFYVEQPVSIGNNVWLGLNTLVVGGEIGDDCFIKPCSLVVGRVSDGMVAAGNPAVPLKPRF